MRTMRIVGLFAMAEALSPSHVLGERLRRRTPSAWAVRVVRVSREGSDLIAAYRIRNLSAEDRFLCIRTVTVSFERSARPVSAVTASWTDRTVIASGELYESRRDCQGQFVGVVHAGDEFETTAQSRIVAVPPATLCGRRVDVSLHVEFCSASCIRAGATVTNARRIVSCEGTPGSS